MPFSKIRLVAPIVIGLAGTPLGARAQAVTPVTPVTPASPASPAASTPAMPAHDMSAMPPGHDMSDMPAGHDMASMPDHAMPAGHATSMAMTSALGPHAMTRDGSGTAWQPDATPMGGLHLTADDWSVMAHGFVNAVVDRQNGPRGADKAFAESMAMLMGHRAAGPGTLGLRAMASLDPTMGKDGYPLLFQTGETADGRTPLVDRQHPHDFVMELSASYSVGFGEQGAAFVYVGLPGEPALGPTAFMHRFSGMRNPEAPLTHHWLDSTHITFGVATLGVSQGPLQLEGSWFNGREPDPARWNIETRHFDSWSTRLSWNPLRELSMQVSYGDLKSPEQLEADVRVRRSTASITFQAAPGGDPWATTLAYGSNRKSGPGLHVTEPGWLLESTYVLRDTHTVFARAERVKNSELFGDESSLHGETFQIAKLSIGYIFDFARIGPVKWGLGGLIGVADAPSRLDSAYGSHPRSAMVFLQARL